LIFNGAAGFGRLAEPWKGHTSDVLRRSFRQPGGTKAAAMRIPTLNQWPTGRLLQISASWMVLPG
jgi:hypothetical protein